MPLELGSSLAWKLSSAHMRSIVVFSALPTSVALVEAVAADAYVSKLEGTDRLLDAIAMTRPRQAA